MMPYSSEFKLNLNYHKYHKVPERVVKEWLPILRHNDIHWLMRFQQFSENLLYNLISQDRTTISILYTQKFSKQFFIDNLSKFESNVNKLKISWPGINIYHYFQRKDYQSWFDDLNMDDTKLQIEMHQYNIFPKDIKRPTEEYLNYVRLSTL